MGKSKSYRAWLVGLFLVPVLGLTACGVDNDDLCYDENRDGLCDDDYSEHEPEVYKVSNGKKLYLRDEDFSRSSGG
jgi:hypothetical protein